MRAAPERERADVPEFLREHSVPMVFSVLLHGALVAALVFTAVISATRAPVYLQSAPVNATVVDSQILHAAQRAQAEHAAEQARAAAQAQAAAAQAAADAKGTEEAKAAEQVKAAADAKAAEEAHAASAAKAAADAKAADEARADAARAAAEAKRQAEAKRAAEEKQAAEAKTAADAKQAAEAKRAADERARKEREEELRRQMADEEHTAAVEASPLKDRYVALLRDRIQNAWIKPSSARVGVDCVVQVTQVPGGEVTSARVTQCNGDAAVRQSIENAVYRASPLPDPPDPALFQRNFAFEFKPNE
jgi:colicin import membrane protein